MNLNLIEATTWLPTPPVCMAAQAPVGHSMQQDFTTRRLRSSEPQSTGPSRRRPWKHWTPLSAASVVWPLPTIMHRHAASFTAISRMPVTLLEASWCRLCKCYLHSTTTAMFSELLSRVFPVVQLNAHPTCCCLLCSQSGMPLTCKAKDKLLYPFPFHCLDRSSHMTCLE